MQLPALTVCILCTVLPVVGLVYLYSNPVVAECKTKSTGATAYLKEENYNRKNLHEEKKSAVDLMLKRLVITTAVSSNHFSEVQSLIGSVQKVMPQTKLVLYDLGMTANQRDNVSKMCGIELRTFNFTKYPEHVSPDRLMNYAWKPLIVYELSKEYEVVMWGDASLRLLKPLQEYVLPYLLDVQVPFVARETNFIIVQMTHDQTLKYLNVTRESMRGLSTVSATAWVVWINEKTKRFVDSWADCALHEECIAPKGAKVKPCGVKPNQDWQEVGYCGCHRFDQSALDVILFREFGDEIFKTAAWNGGTIEIDKGDRDKRFNFPVKYCFN